MFLVSYVLPENAGRRAAVAACERGLRRLKTDRIDLYLLHWRGDLPFVETLEAFAELKAAGKNRHFGVSNLDLADSYEWWALAGGESTACSQLLYNLTRRRVEFDLLPWLRARHVPVMAYSPLEQARLLAHVGLRRFCARHQMTPAEAALAWLLSQHQVIVIPKSASVARVRENLRAATIWFDAAQRDELDTLFPPPTRARPLEMLWERRLLMTGLQSACDTSARRLA